MTVKTPDTHTHLQRVNAGNTLGLERRVMRSPVRRLHCVTLMRLLSATVASYKDTHSRSPSVICPLSLCLAPVQRRRESAASYSSAAHVGPL